MHPQLAAYLIGRPLPPQPGEAGQTPVSMAVRPRETGADHQRAEALCLAGICGFPGACGGLCFWAGDDAKGGC